MNRSDELDGTDHTPSTITASRAPVVQTTPMKPTRTKTNPPFDAEPSEIENRADHTECVAIGKHLAQECPKLIIYERDENENEQQRATCQEKVKSLAILRGRQRVRRRRSAVAREARKTLVGF